MCQFVSWIKCNGVILFLEDKDLQGKAGKELKDYCKNKNDWRGHGAIRRVYELDNLIGKDYECTDFSSPSNFPNEIVEAIKDGRMTVFGAPEQLLSPSACKQYEAVKKPAWVQYKAVEESTLDQYEVIEESAWKQYEAVKKAAYEQYATVRKPALEQYEAAVKSAREQYDVIIKSAREKYEAVRKSAREQYDVIIKSAWEQCQAVTKPAWEQYEEVTHKEFWRLFSSEENRAAAWRSL